MTNQQFNTQPRKPGGQPGNQNAANPASQPSQKPTEKKEPKKRGAPYGNNNAQTYGFYSRRLSPQILEGLETTTEFSLKDEIEVMRVFARKLAELGANVKDVDEAKSLLNALSTATNAINRLVRTHTRIPDPALDPGRMLRQTLLELEDEWPELGELVKDYPLYVQDPTHPAHPSNHMPRVPIQSNEVIDLDPDDEGDSPAQP